MMIKYDKPLPVPTPESKPFWDYCKQHELRMQKCTQCGHIRNPEAEVCPHCQSRKFDWAKLSGRGKVYSFGIVHYVYNPAFAKDIPYVVASIELEEGPRMLSNITGCKPEDVKINQPVVVYFEDVTEEFALPKFKPAI
jgi:uncharacterized OB-fold protein